MNHVLVSISFRDGYEHTSGHRTSDGWVCDSRYYEYPVFKFSSPFASLSGSIWTIILDYLAPLYRVDEWEEGFRSSHSYHYSEPYTIEFVLFLNSLGIPNTVFSCIGKDLEFGFSWENGEVSTTEGCPVKELEDVKQLLLLCREFGLKYAPSWLDFLIKSSSEDLGPFLKSLSITP